jgi:hypothetical protein
MERFHRTLGRVMELNEYVLSIFTVTSSRPGRALARLPQRFLAALMAENRYT